MASNSGDSQEHHGSLSTGNKLGVLILGSEWESSKGGLSTINREFAIHLAKHSKVHVTFYVPQCNDGDKSAANAQNIDLREAQRVPGMDKLLWLSVPPHDLPIDVVVGHGAKLGPQAKAIKMIRGNCRWVQFVHTAPEELGMHKDYPNPISNGQEKHGIEVELCENADFVVTVGPKLNEAFRCYLSSCKTDQNVFCLTPGLFSEFSEIVQVPERSGNFQVLLFGRGDAEDFLLKGFDIAAEAIALLTNTHLIFVGATEGEQDDTAKRFLDRNIPTEALHVRSFSNRECLKKIFYEVDLAIMPSRTEGFGLTGLEALSAGLPILVSHNSGFGEALSNVRFGSYSLVKSNEASSWSDAIKDVMGKSRELRLEESKALRESYEKRYSWEEQIEELVQKMITLVYGPDLECQSVTKQSITSPQSLVSTEDQQGTVPIEFRLKQVTYKDDISRDSDERVMKEMARRFLEKKGDEIALKEWSKSLHYYIKGMLDLKETKASEGSLRISVECRTLPILERLWEDYRCGHLNEVAEKRLLTDDIKEKFYVESVKLETIILEEDYLACKLFLMDTSTADLSAGRDSSSNSLPSVKTVSQPPRCTLRSGEADSTANGVISFPTERSAQKAFNEKESYSAERNVPEAPRDQSTQTSEGCTEDCRSAKRTNSIDKKSEHSLGNKGSTLLHLAAQSGNVDTIETILSLGLDIDSRNSSGLTPLMLAVLNGLPDAFHFLIERGSDPALKGSYGRSVLHFAVEGGSKVSIEKLLSLELDIDSRDSDGYTPLMIAVLTGQPDAFHFLVERGSDPRLKSNNGRSVLHHAAQGGSKVIIEKLLSLELDIDSRDSDGLTPLIIAVLNGQRDAFHFLIERGSDPTLKSNDGRSVLHSAAQIGIKVIIEKLLSLELDIDSRDSDGLTPLMIAAFTGQPDAFHFLLEKGSDPTLKSNDGRSVLHFAAGGGRKVIIEKLLSLELDIDSRDRAGETPLMIAAGLGKTEAVKYLLSKGARP